MQTHHTTRREKHFIDLTGKRFVRWQVLCETSRPEHVKTKQPVSYWLCRCDCGIVRAVLGQSLRGGVSQSCGCKNREEMQVRRIKHGLGRTAEYKIWCAIRARCRRPSHVSYANYGGRGITVCDRWRESFENFLADMGPRPSPEYSIERRQNDGPYSPENCYWATREQQGNNKRNNIKLTHDGITLSLAQWARRLRISQTAIYQRYSKGLSPEKVLYPGKLPRERFKNKP